MKYIISFFVILCSFWRVVINEDLTTIGLVENSTELTTLNGPTSTENFNKITTERLFDKPRQKNLNKPKLVCPGKDIRRPFFSLPCRTTKDCRIFGKNILCCDNACLKGVPPPPPEPIHSPLLFGLVERVCPAEPIPEILDVQECTIDEECMPRICCPEKMLDGVVKGFCRTPEPKLDRVPGAKQFFEPIRTVMGYMQCTPPPPPVLDVFPKPCNSPLDCFPNLCCQERGKKVCRPPKRSLFALVAAVGQRIVPEDAARIFISRIT